MLGSRATALAIGVAVLGLAGGARAQTVDQGRRLYLEANFRGAREAFAAALERRRLDEQEAASAHAHLAALDFMFGEEGRARQHAEAALALDPALALPEGAPPPALALWESARDRLDGRRAALTLSFEDGGVVVARLAPAPRLLASELTLECRSEGGGEGREEWSQRGPPPQVRLHALDATIIECTARALTTGGAVLLEATASPEPEPEPAPRVRPASPTRPPPSEQPSPSRPSNRRGLWLGLGIGAAVIVIVTAVVLGTTLSEDTANLDETVIEGW